VVQPEAVGIAVAGDQAKKSLAVGVVGEDRLAVENRLGGSTASGAGRGAWVIPPAPEDKGQNDLGTILSPTAR
jgi:hypothetical protein